MGAMRATLGFLWLALAASCHEDAGHCDGGECVCPPGASCELECDAPPCHVLCAEDNPRCEATCGNGDCVCGPGSNCDFVCHSPPCHVDCAPDADCFATCGNGECTCAAGSACAFTCDAGPCHVQCEGDHPHCDGQCANGTCTCGPNSSCAFECLDANCHTYCEAGSECLLRCSQPSSGVQGCQFDRCAAGVPELCPDGITLRCGDIECPEERS